MESTHRQVENAARSWAGRDKTEWVQGAGLQLLPARVAGGSVLVATGHLESPLGYGKHCSEERVGQLTQVCSFPAWQCRLKAAG